MQPHWMPIHSALRLVLAGSWLSALMGFVSPSPTQVESSQWAIVDYVVVDEQFTDEVVVAESALGVGIAAFDEMVERAQRRPGRRSLREGQYRFIWTQPEGRGARVRSELLERRVPFVSEIPKSLFFFDARINADGSYLALQSLYSDMPERSSMAAQFLRDNLRVENASAKTESIQVFVGLNVTQAGEVGYFIAGAGEAS